MKALNSKPNFPKKREIKDTDTKRGDIHMNTCNKMSTVLDRNEAHIKFKFFAALSSFNSNFTKKTVLNVFSDSHLLIQKYLL